MDISELAQLWAALPQISGIHASGDGRWAFFCAAGLNEVDEVYAVPTDGSAPPVQLTWGVLRNRPFHRTRVECRRKTVRPVVLCFAGKGVPHRLGRSPG